MIYFLGFVGLGAFVILSLANRPVNHVYVDTTLEYPNRPYITARDRMFHDTGVIGNQFINMEKEEGGYLGIPLSYHTLPNGTRVRIHGHDHAHMYNM